MMNHSIKEEKKIVWENNEKREDNNVVAFPSRESTGSQDEAFRTHIEISSPGVKPAEIIYITSGFGQITENKLQAKAA
ncbi:hypothetical protein ACFQPF_15930 [Fictibacillus iocasae]|uniref:Uncharacterized protein n=1 Tax=Fictibacillus iocasae TaxID=2715437 RepID=A0ABW2NTL0_9BACL